MFHRRLHKALCGLAALLVPIGLFAAPVTGSPGSVQGYRFLLADVEAEPGEALTLTVAGEYEQSAQGFVMAARYPSADLAITEIHFRDTILEAINIDFFDATVDPVTGTVIVSALIDATPPFDGELIPAVGFALDLFHIEATVSTVARGELEVALEDGLSFPPVSNMYTVDNVSVPVTELGGSSILLTGTSVKTEPGKLFIRGDANLSRQVDIADAVTIIAFVFYGDSALTCLLAADANDDDGVDISDPIWILQHLFSGGPAPAAPYPSPGADPTPGKTTCAQGLAP